MLFDLFNFLILLTALFVIITTNQVHALFCLISVFIQLTILLLAFYDLEFIPFLIVIVYIGAIAILFLFVVMMLDINVTSKTTNSYSIGFILTSLFLTYFFYQKQDFSIYFDTHMLFWTVDFDMIIDLAKILNRVIPEPDRFISLESDLAIEVHRDSLKSFLDLLVSSDLLDLPTKDSLSTESLIPVNLGWENLISIGTDLEAISMVLYTEFSIPVLLSSFVLLLAMIGAITLTLKQKPFVKRQQIPAQNFRDFEHSIRRVS